LNNKLPYELISIFVLIIIWIQFTPLIIDFIRSKEKRIIKKSRGEREIWLKLSTKK